MAGRAVIIFLFLIVACGVGLITQIGEIRDFWAFRSHATKTALLSIDNRREFTTEGYNKGTTYTYTEGDYVFATAKGVEITITKQRIPDEILQNYLSGRPIILYYDDNSPQNFRFDGQTSSIFWVAVGCVAFAGFLVILARTLGFGR